MSKFSMKAEKVTSTSNADWEGFNQHLLEVIGEDVESQIGVISGIVDLGLQKRDSYVEKYKGTPEQDKKLEGNYTYLSEDGEEIITELSDAKQIAIMVDFPELMVNYGKYLSEDGEDDFKPYRHLITNQWWNDTKKQMEAKGVSLTCRKSEKTPSGYAYDEKSTISKLAISSKKSSKPVCQDFEVLDLLGGYITMNINAEESKDGKYVNVNAKDISGVHKSINTDDIEYDLEPFAVLFDYENSDECLKQLRESIKNTMKKAINWEDSAVKKQLEDLAKEYQNSKKEESDKNKAKGKSSKKKKPKKVATKRKEVVEEDDNDECPFDED